jgi:hypothetical protein
METLGNQIMLKLCPKFYCEICDYGTSKKSSFVNHTISLKHQKLSNGNTLASFGNENMLKLCFFKYSCPNCNKEFKNRSGLWKHKHKHKHKCENIKEYTDNTDNTDNNDNNLKETEAKELIQYLMKENSEFKQLIIEQNKQMIELSKNSAGHHNTINNNSNTSFKIDFTFLDFFNSVKIGVLNVQRCKTYKLLKLLQ